MSEPNREPTDEPTTDRQEAQREGRQMGRGWLGIAIVSIFGLLLIVIALMQATGLMDVFAPVAETETQQWAVFGVLVLIWLGVAGWSWNAFTG
ncbi:hypothetical protein AB7C87_19595 [Natrarchaeobius sp. A-rgal3]|uniref:hypothetical protein n=1 Tax=Natrarchaeobius versutus TaxID=1679078 RepID=UPI00350E9CC2